MSIPDEAPLGSDARFEDSVRYGSGVPEGLRYSDLSFIEMTGIPRRSQPTETAIQPVHDADDSLPPLAVSPMQADAQFRLLIAELSAANDGAPSLLGTETPTRPPGATQALAEAEFLLNALELRGTTRNP